MVRGMHLVARGVLKEDKLVTATHANRRTTLSTFSSTNHVFGFTFCTFSAVRTPRDHQVFQELLVFKDKRLILFNRKVKN